jgi:phosphoserine phosphatase
VRDLLDVEQIVVRGRLTSTSSSTSHRATRSSRTCCSTAGRTTLRRLRGRRGRPAASTERVGGDRHRSEVGPSVFGAVAAAIASGNGNIDRIFRLSRYPVIAYELAITDGDIDAMRRALVDVAAGAPVDIAIQAEGLHPAGQAAGGTGRRLDAHPERDDRPAGRGGGMWRRGRGITVQAMDGELDFETAARRVRLLAGTPADGDRAGQQPGSELTPGARTFVGPSSARDAVGVVSGGFTVFTDRLRINSTWTTPRRTNSKSSTVSSPESWSGRVVDRQRKAEVLREMAASTGFRSSRLWRSGMVPTISICWRQPVSGLPSTPSRCCQGSRGHRAECALPRRRPVPARHPRDEDVSGTDEA